jgi:hypothetical protein
MSAEASVTDQGQLEAVPAVVTEAPEDEDISRLDPTPSTFTLASGTEVNVARLKSRQFFKMLRIITHGGSQALGMMNFDASDTDEFVTQLTALVVFAIPESEEETIEFVKSMCEPANLAEDRKLAEEQRRALRAELDNPELDDLVSVIEVIVRREGADLKALGTRLMAMMKFAQKSGQIPEVDASTSSADSPEPSTSSPPSTDGPTSTSSTSPSVG